MLNNQNFLIYFLNGIRSVKVSGKKVNGMRVDYGFHKVEPGYLILE